MEQQKHYIIKENQIIYDFMLTMKYLSDFGQERFGSDFRILRVSTDIPNLIRTFN